MRRPGGIASSRSVLTEVQDALNRARECTFLLVARPRGARGSDVAPLGEKSIGCVRLCRTGSAPSRHATASPQRERTTPSPKSEIVFNPIFWSKGELLSIP
jgi:hypothetical protein